MCLQLKEQQESSLSSLNREDEKRLGGVPAKKEDPDWIKIIHILYVHTVCDMKKVQYSFYLIHKRPYLLIRFFF